MSSQIITLAASLIALATSLLSIWVSTRLAIHKERRQVLWSKEVDRFFALEELAGTLVEELDSHQALERSNVVQALEEFRHTAGRFADIPLCCKRSAIFKMLSTACSLRSGIMRMRKRRWRFVPN